MDPDAFRDVVHDPDATSSSSGAGSESASESADDFDAPPAAAARNSLATAGSARGAGGGGSGGGGGGGERGREGDKIGRSCVRCSFLRRTGCPCDACLYAAHQMAAETMERLADEAREEMLRTLPSAYWMTRECTQRYYGSLAGEGDERNLEPLLPRPVALDIPLFHVVQEHEWRLKRTSDLSNRLVREAHGVDKLPKSSALDLIIQAEEFRAFLEWHGLGRFAGRLLAIGCGPGLAEASRFVTYKDLLSVGMSSSQAEVARAALDARRTGGSADLCRRPGCGGRELRYERSRPEGGGEDAADLGSAAFRCACRVCGWERPVAERQALCRRTRA